MALTRALLVIAAALLAARAPRAQDAVLDAPAATAKPAATALDAIDAFLRESRAPGISVAIRMPDEGVWASGFGLADVENEVPVTERTVFRLASISKPVTATIAMRLAARGELDLDAPVHTLVPQWPEKRWPVTTRQLLAHLGGVRHYVGDEMSSSRFYSAVPEAIAIFAADPLLHEPGTGYRYTTHGFTLAGAACVATSGRSFRELLRDEIVAPAGCATLQFDDHDRLIPHRAQGYRVVDEELRNARPVDTSNKVPGGGMCATATDLVRFAGALLDGVLLDDERREEMWTEQRTTDGKGTGYGLGWSVGQRDGRRVVAHSGAQPRVSTILVIDVERRVSVAVLCNLEGQGRRLRALADAVGDAGPPR